MELNSEFHIKFLFIPGEGGLVRTTYEAGVMLSMTTEACTETLRKLNSYIHYPATF
jgi:hypothetical protein